MALLELGAKPWLWIALSSGAIACGLLLLAAFFSLLALIRDGVRGDWFTSGVAAASLLTICRSVPLAGASGAAFIFATNAAILGFSAFLIVSALAFWVESLDRRLLETRLRRQPGFSAPPAGTSSRSLAFLRGLTSLCFAGSWAALSGLIVLGRASEPRRLLAWLALLAALGAGAQLLSVGRARFEDRLPELEVLDRRSYRSALHAFPWLTIHLVSGSVWAYDAWGSYLGWQPLQGWVFAAWLYLALLLHLERGKRCAWVAGSAGIIFVMAAFAVNGVHGFWPV